MPNYSKAKIYKLVNDLDDEIYIGSTCQLLCQRLAVHKSLARKGSTMKCLQHFNTIGWDTVKIILIENCPCNSKEELLAIERKWIEEIGTLNTQCPGRTDKEYYEDNKEIISIKNRERYQLKREEKLEKQKEYRMKNRELLNEKQKSYYEANKDIINEKRRVKRVEA